MSKQKIQQIIDIANIHLKKILTNQNPLRSTKCRGSFEKSLFSADISPSAFSKILIKIGIFRGDIIDRLIFLWNGFKNIHADPFD